MSPQLAEEKPITDNPLRKFLAMRLFLENKFKSFLACGIAGGVIGLALLGAAPKLKEGFDPPKVRVDDTPISREGALRASFAPTIKKASPSVVYIYTKKQIQLRRRQPFFPFGDPWFDRYFRMPPLIEQREQRGLGSGVIVSEDGYILTSYHVVEGVDEIEVLLEDGESPYTAKIVGTDLNTDIAVIKIQAKGLPAITLGDSDNLEVGDVVLAIGNPFAIGKTVTMGIVSATGRSGRSTLAGGDPGTFIQTDAAINRGNSGGALVDADGRLIGINTAIATQGGGYDGVGFAIPINIARNVMNNLATHGEAARGYLGIGFQPITPDLAEEFGIDEARGILVTYVVPDSPAEKADIRDADAIVELNGKPVKNLREFQSNIASSPGKEIQLKIIRNGEEKDIEVTLETLDESPFWNEDSADNPLSGIQVEDLTRRWRQHFGIPPQISGAIVVNVAPSSLAYQQVGIRAGNIIQSINREPVANAQDANRLIRRLKGDRVLLKLWRDNQSVYLVIHKRR